MRFLIDVHRVLIMLASEVGPKIFYRLIIMILDFPISSTDSYELLRARRSGLRIAFQCFQKGCATGPGNLQKQGRLIAQAHHLDGPISNSGKRLLTLRFEAADSSGEEDSVTPELPQIGEPAEPPE